MAKPLWLRVLGWLIGLLVLIQVINVTSFVFLPHSRALLGGIIATALLGTALLAAWVIGSVTVYAARQRSAASALTLNALNRSHAAAPGDPRQRAAAPGARGPTVMTSPLNLSAIPTAPGPAAAPPPRADTASHTGPVCWECREPCAELYCYQHNVMLCAVCVADHTGPRCAYARLVLVRLAAAAEVGG